MKSSEYQEIIREYHKVEKSRNALKLLHEKFPNVPEKTLDCIVYQERQRRTKWSLQKHRSPERASSYYQQYKSFVERNEKPGFLITMANNVGLCPALMARIILEQHYANTESEQENPASKQQLSEMMRDTSLIQDKHLSAEIHLCILSDAVYGPITDALRHGIGAQYENKLKEELKQLDLYFLDENVLRSKGYDKTPDIKLEIPIAINGHVVNWIESKALFGDWESHKSYLKDQYWCYWNRFGPGLVIYWFGYIEEIDIHEEKGIMIRDHMPRDIVHMNPNRQPCDV